MDSRGVWAYPGAKVKTGDCSGGAVGSMVGLECPCEHIGPRCFDDKWGSGGHFTENNTGLEVWKSKGPSCLYFRQLSPRHAMSGREAAL